MDLRLKDLKALVTGSSKGLGFAAARVLSHEGAQVVVNGRDEARIREVAKKISNESGNPVFGFRGDVREPSVPADLVNKAAESMGGLDILICNAGGPPAGSFESFDEAAWQNAINLSFMSNVRLIKAALPFLRKSTAASVLTITSYAVKQPIPNLVLSNSIRAATAGLTKSLCLEFGGEGIRFNSIMPGWTETERVTELMSGRARNNGTTIQAEAVKQASESALGRMGTMEEFANAAVFLVSPLASYLTGILLPVDGGIIKGTF
jgi:3-oxoacyl-[acyl-carrier protein] reductase